MIETKIKEATQSKDVYPALFCTDDRGLVVVAIEDLGGGNFAGVVVHPKEKFGQYSTTWSKSKFRRMPKDSEFTMKFIQE